VHVWNGSRQNTIGTNGDGISDAAERNLLSGSYWGVAIRGVAGQLSQNVVAGNLIGTDRTGTRALPNHFGVGFAQFYGSDDPSGDRIGTDGNGVADADERNVISANDWYGISPGGGTPTFHSELIAGNYIGTDVTGTQGLGNGHVGIVVSLGSHSTTIGGSAPVFANTIAFNNGPGIWIVNASIIPGDPHGIHIVGNSIHDNTGLGIDLGGDLNLGQYPTLPLGPVFLGVTLNDSLGHVGPNHFQNFPVLNSAISSGTSTSITGTFSSGTASGQPYLPNTTFTLDFYANPTADPSGYGEGQTYLGSSTVTTDANGNVTFTVDLATGNLSGQWISATATDPSGNTSEFSADVQASTAPSQSFASYLQANLPGSSTTANSMTIQASADTTPATVIQAVNGLTNVTQPVTIILDLGGGTYSTGGVATNPPPNVTLVIQNGTLDPAYPALTVSGGIVFVLNCTLFTTGDAPTILVTGGSLTLRNDIVQESTTATQAAIAISGGSVDLGTATSPGNNTLNVNGAGQPVQNRTSTPISAVGDTFESGGTILPAPALSFTTLTSSANPTTLNQSVTLTATVRANGASGTPTGSVDFFDTTANTDLGSVALFSGTASLSSSALAAGNHVIQARYSGDATFLPSLDSITQGVQYKFSGFLAPLNSTTAMALNRTVPIKFQLSDYNYRFISSLSAIVSLQILNGQGQNVLTNAGSTALRYDSTANQYIANWQTKGLPAGTYTVTLVLADGTTYTKSVTLSKNGSSAGLMVDGISNLATTAIGALLGGDITLYVDNTNGDLTAAELARIQDAVTAVDAVTEPYGMAVTEVTDPTLADVTLNMDTTSAVGGYADGVLGCTTDASQITIINGWNFYAGSDATQIGSGQYDFETVVTHELGHALGLGHSTDSTSVMCATLNTGTVNRNLTTADLNLADSDTSGACGLHAVMIPSLAAAIASNSLGSNAPDRDAFFALLNTSTPAPGLAPNAAFQNPAHDLVFADPTGQFGAVLAPANRAALKALPMFGTTELPETDQDPFGGPTLFSEVLPVGGEVPPAPPIPDAGGFDAGLEFIPADGVLVVES
jgi:hypothetical protein